MKRLLLFLLPTFLFASSSYAQQDEQAMHKAYMDYMTPGEVHKMLAKADGTWAFDMKFWMDPAAAPTQANGTTENKMILGGRYQESVHKCEMMGMPFEGRSVTAYDNAKKMFQSTWVDNMGTGIMNMTGKWNDADKSITFTGSCYDPSKGKDVGMKEVLTMIDDDHHKMEMYAVNDGKEVKTMEIVYTRKK